MFSYRIHVFYMQILMLPLSLQQERFELAQIAFQLLYTLSSLNPRVQHFCSLFLLPRLMIPQLTVYFIKDEKDLAKAGEIKH